MKIYIAGRYARREELLKLSKEIEALGHLVTSRWLLGEEEGKTLEEVAVMDYEDVNRAGMALVFTDPHGSKHTGGGRHTELGLAYAWGKMVWIVGEKEQVFHSLPKIKHFDNFQQAIGGLKTLPKENEFKPSEFLKRNPLLGEPYLDKSSPFKYTGTSIT